jgi:hypothetical protein
MLGATNPSEWFGSSWNGITPYQGMTNLVILESGTQSYFTNFAHVGSGGTIT